MPLRHRPSPPAGMRRRRDRAAREGGAPSLSPDWRAWIAENLLLDVTRDDVVKALIESDVPRALAAREVDAAATSPWMVGARRVTRLARRHAVVVRLRRAMESVASSGGGVERRSGVPREEFFDRYYATNVPVLLSDALDPWPAARTWSPAELARRFGDVEVEVSADRDADPFYEPNFKQHATTRRLADLCRAIEEAGPTNDVYVVANNRLTKNPGMAKLLDDVRAPHPYLDDRRDGECVSVWLGPAGTVTPLHHDTANVLFCQVHGRKRLLLFPSFELSLTHDVHHGVYSRVDAEAPDVEAFPAFASVTRKEVVVSPGECLFIPVGWWHHVRALDPSVSVAFTNFRAKNGFDWYYPGNVK